jgi:hypothetical protein
MKSSLFLVVKENGFTWIRILAKFESKWGGERKIVQDCCIQTSLILIVCLIDSQIPHDLIAQIFKNKHNF